MKLPKRSSKEAPKKNTSSNSKDGKTDKVAGPNPRLRFWLWYGLFTLVMLWIWQEASHNLNMTTIPYSTFKTQIRDRNVKEVVISEKEITGELHSAKPLVEISEAEDPKAVKPFFRTIRVGDDQLVEQLETENVRITGTKPSLLTEFLWAWMLPIVLMVFLWLFVFRRIGRAGQSMLSVGKSRAKLASDDDTGVSFKDVAGCDEAKEELEEVVDFLKDKSRYEKLGARIPKGVLLVGPPGTGKTLLARAVAGEAGVPFFSLSGSDFVEMFVGVGASRVRDLFHQAKDKSPCIIFIDELDAIGKQRGAGHMGGAVNDEREQTLNQLLSEMDGFGVTEGIIMLAATNRPEVLDRALLRPGRFDRQVVVDAPDIKAREDILKVHSRGKPLADEVDLSKIAQGTPGFSGADLANTVNEAALLAVRNGSDRISQLDLENAIEKVVAGPERKSRRLEEEERRLVAYHEVGHALVAAFSEHAEPVHKISIIPRGRAALGYTMQIPAQENFLVTEAELQDKLKGLLGGRAAEQVVFGFITTGAENDLDKATVIAQQMVCVYGMSAELGLPQLIKTGGARYLQGGGHDYSCSPKTAAAVDQEVRRILDEAYAAAIKILTEKRQILDKVANYLMAKETIDAPTLLKLIDREDQRTPRVLPMLPFEADSDEDDTEENEVGTKSQISSQDVSL